MENPNIANDLDESKLASIAIDVLRRAQQDLDSMKDWCDSVDKGLDLCKAEFAPKSEPWDGAANYKTTLLTEASNNFGNRASVELMRDPELVKAQIVGLRTLRNVIDKKQNEVATLQEQLEPIMQHVKELQQQGGDLDPEIQKQIDDVKAAIAEKVGVIKAKKAIMKEEQERADRVTEFLNWQINVNMPEWRKDQKRLMYSLPNVGSIFKKTYYDSSKGRCVSDIINYPDFIVNQSTVCIDDARSFTHVLSVSKSKCVENIKAGLWRDCELFCDDALGDEMSNEDNGADAAIRNDDCFYEQYCWADLDDDGLDEPYIVTVHKQSAQVLRVVARFDYDDIIVKFGDMKPSPLLDAQKARAAKILADAKELGTTPELPDALDLSGYKIIRIEACSIITKYGFIPSPDGSFLDVGFFHVIGSTALGVNKVTNDLLNAGTLANNQMGMTAKGFRKRQGDFKFKMGQLMATEIPPEQLQNSIYMLNFKEPSATLFQLNESMKASAGSFSANVDQGGQIQSNTAPTTALAMLQESLIPHTAHLSLITDSMSNEFSILFELNGDYLDDDEYRAVCGDDEAIVEDDFSEDGLSVVCSANPELSSRSQRMMLADAEMAQIPTVMQAGGNAIPIIKNYFARIGTSNIDEIFPNEAEMSPADRQARDQLKASQDQANNLQEQQNKIQELQVQLLTRAEDRKDAEFKLKQQEALTELDQKMEEVRKTQAETLLILEQAETEQTKNKISIYTTHSAELDKAEAALQYQPSPDLIAQQAAAQPRQERVEPQPEPQAMAGQEPAQEQAQDAQQ